MPKFVADLHLHSAYARATSKDLNFDTLFQWAKWKGIHLLSSADFTHPVWWQETKRKLKESNYDGFYRYNGTHFILGSEISSIYSQEGKLRRIHCLLYFPQIADVEKFNNFLSNKANLKTDGRPVVGLSAKQLLDLALSVNEKAILIPAHAWTPWFGLYGSSSGFDSIEECFGDLSKYVYAIETGLSSDPAMSWRVRELDGKAIVSFSDAHSAVKIGREATIFETDFSYSGLLKTLRNTPNYNGRILYTIEFFPEEGKYHFTGHRKCGVYQSPKETDKYGEICPYCKKKLTIGVMHRVEQLADRLRPAGFRPKNRPSFKRFVPLLEILAEGFNSSPYSKRVREEYNRLIGHFGSELFILEEASISEIEKVAVTAKIAQGIEKVRRGDIVIRPGFDGVYGSIKIWQEVGKSVPANNFHSEGQISLFEN